MKESTKYAYEKRIKELQQELNICREYRHACKTIFDTAVRLVGEGKVISTAWVIGRIGALLP